MELEEKERARRAELGLTKVKLPKINIDIKHLLGKMNRSDSVGGKKRLNDLLKTSNMFKPKNSISVIAPASLRKRSEKASQLNNIREGAVNYRTHRRYLPIENLPHGCRNSNNNHKIGYPYSTGTGPESEVLSYSRFLCKKLGGSHHSPPTNPVTVYVPKEIQYEPPCEWGKLLKRAIGFN